MNELLKLAFSQKGVNGQRLVILIALVFLAGQFREFDRRLTRIELKLWPDKPSAQKTTHESTNVFSFVRPGVIDGLQIHAD